MKVFILLQCWKVNEAIYPIPASTSKKKGMEDSHWVVLEELCHTNN